MATIQARRRLVERLEAQAALSPGRYRIKLVLLAGLGYAVLATALLLTLGTVAFLLLYMAVNGLPRDPMVVVPILMLGTFGVVILRGLWIRFTLPEGHLLEPGQAPALRQEVERVRAAVGARPVDAIVIDASLNAAAAHLPAGLGPWGTRQILVIGLPLMQVLDREELASVIAHEFGHFHGGHGRLGGWIYRLRSSWQRILLAGGGGALLFLFFRWYAPYFDAYSRVLARGQEYAADAVAARVQGPATAARALVRIALASAWMQREFWPQVHAAARLQAWPPVQVHRRLASGLHAALEGEAQAPSWSLCERPHPDDTHPTLRRRLDALQVESPMLVAAEPRGAPSARLLGGLEDELQARFSEEWREAAGADWQSLHQQAQEGERALQALESLARRGPFEAARLACLSEDHRPGADHVALYRDALALAPADARCRQRLGRLLLAQGHVAEGLDELERAMAQEPAAIAPGLESIEGLRGIALRDPALRERASALHARFAARLPEPGEAEDAVAAAALQPHGLDAAQLQRLSAALAHHERIKAAWVARQSTADAASVARFVVLLEWSGSMASERAMLPRLVAQLALPGPCSVITAHSDRALATRVREVAGEPVHRKGTRRR
jgi:Zn-dependent protease with chaperone function